MTPFAFRRGLPLRPGISPRQRMQRGIIGLKCGNRLLQGLRAEVIGPRVDVREDRGGAKETDYFRGGNEGERSGENGITGTHSIRHQSQEQSIRPRTAGDGMGHPDISSKALLELSYLRSQDVLAVGEDGPDPCLNPVADALLLAAQVDKLHRFSASPVLRIPARSICFVSFVSFVSFVV